MKFRARKAAGAALSTMAVVLAHPASARDEGPQSEMSADIIVTAQKRAENLQDVPISIAAFSDAALLKANVNSPQDLGRIAPNFQATRSTTVAGFRVNIRGVGGFGNSAIEPSAAVYLDGVYIPRPGSVVGAFLDIENVEVLRGPQGTLFGRNASVGALSLHSAAPKSDFSGRMTAEYGTGDRYRLDGYVNVPVTDQVAFRLAGLGQSFGGFWKNNLDGKTYGGADSFALRASVKADLGSAEWTMRADLAKTDGDGYSGLDFDPDTVSPAQLENLRTLLGGQLPDTNLKDRRANQYIVADLHDRQWGVSSELSLDLAGFTLRLINSYRDWSTRQSDGDTASLPVDVFTRQVRFKSKSQNHELQFISPQREWLGGHLDFVGGLYFFEEDYQIGEEFFIGDQFCRLIFGASPTTQANCEAARVNAAGAPGTQIAFDQNVRSMAAYVQPTIHLTERLSVSLGGRITQDKKRGTFAQSVVDGGIPYFGILRAPERLTLPRIKDDRFTYRLNLTYKPTDNVMIFTNFSTGYKSGGYNAGGASPPLSTFDANGNLISTRRVFDRESVKNYELGAKTDWWDGRLKVNATLYRMDISGYQDRANDGISFVVRNAGTLRQQGLELDTSITPARGFAINASLAYLDSGFLSFPAASGLPGIGGVQNLKGKPIQFSPKWSGTIGVNLDGDVGSSGMTWEASANTFLVSKQFVLATTDANPQGFIDGYATIGARLALNGRDDRWTVAIFGSNLTNQSAADLAIYQALDGPLGLRNGVFPGSSAIRFSRGAPRTLGVSGTVRF